MDEIERSIDLSAGLNFIYLVGNRYGSMYVPLEIAEDEFESIMEIVRERTANDVELMKKWFQLDRNSSPPKYVYLVSEILSTTQSFIFNLADYHLFQTFRRIISRTTGRKTSLAT